MQNQGGINILGRGRLKRTKSFPYITMRTGVAAKLSKIEYDMFRLDASRKEILDLYKSQGKDVPKIEASHERQKRNIDSVIAKISDPETVDILRLENGGAKPSVDQLVVIGGDNFFQICAHHYPDTFLVGINSDPTTSHGALLNFTPKSFVENADRILSKHTSYEEWSRISTEINGKQIESGVCTVALSIMATDMISRYNLNLKGNQEEQKSTGILIVTGAGSGDGAWYRNAGMYLPMVKSGLYPKMTQKFPPYRELRTLTREPFNGIDCPYQGLNLQIERGDELELTYWANDPSELSVDSVFRYKVEEGDHLSFKHAEKPLRVIRK